jgi:hypothetical protein
MTKPKPLPPIDELRKRLAYRSDGVLIWKRINVHNTKPGRLAGSMHRCGYLYVRINNVAYAAHRVIWAIIKREDPTGAQIDHINGNKVDNRIENLRKASQSQNQHNRRKSKGCYFHKFKKVWVAQIYLNGKHIHVGHFHTQEKAREAYLRAKEKLHGEFMPTEMKHELGQIDGPTSQLDLFND